MTETGNLILVAFFITVAPGILFGATASVAAGLFLTFLALMDISDAIRHKK